VSHSTIIRRAAFVACVLAGGAAGHVGPAAAQPARPDILVVVTDDQRWDSLSGMPTVRRELVGKGVTFTRAFAVNPLCCPSRASILTGLNSHSTLVYRNSPPYGGWASFDDSSTLATWLQGAGYRTGYFGKYLNGYRVLDVPPGWDEWFGYEKGFYDYTVSHDGVARRFGSAPRDYSTDVLTRAARSFVERGGDEPLLLFYAPYAPHAPATPAPRHVGALPGVRPFRPAAYDEADVSDKPAWMRGHDRLTARERRRMDDLGADMKRSLLAVDDGIEDLLGTLESAGRLSNTLIVFTSDNGLMWGEHRWTDMKSTPYEESIRIPLVVRWDALGEPSRVEKRLATNLDLAPTFADVAGASAPGVEGLSLVPLLAEEGAAWRSEILLEHLRGKRDRTRNVPTYCGVRTDRWKYVAYSTYEDELYDLARDPAELSSLAGSDAHRSRLLDLRRDVRRLCDPLPPGLSLEWLCTHEPSGSGSIAIGSSLGDTFCGSARADTLSGGEGDDVLFGRAGRDRLVGGPGGDVFYGGYGPDRVEARDGTRDVIVCGPGRDVVFADLLDGVGRGCEVVRRSA
jgi:arylsulfatase A-like enzyme